MLLSNVLQRDLSPVTNYIYHHKVKSARYKSFNPLWDTTFIFTLV